MIVHVRARKWLGRFRFALLFVVFTFALYHVLLVVTRWLEPEPKYKEPAGRAVKAFQNGHVAAVPDKITISERLKLFYRIGE
ncbi:DUF4227 family protein [Paenibacillus tyrfis]|uniref:DUF4227 domain-containing protein n=1 Tax=Paenibacillus tyrfis TaxID=1501230 RepID=A0A081P652_9BACL|nr:DUF4227 family protein [Paenibacillus tyrfis]KEQ26175.1 hypothetical protein ET33_36980 [Paenibacillus tyrfis]